MAPQPDLQKPHDTYSLLGENWPSESESAYRTAEVAADDASTAAATQSQSATDAGTQMADESGQTADAVSGGYGSAAAQLNEQSRNFATISAWMTDAGSKVLGAKRRIRQLVRSGTQEIRDALDSELRGTPVNPSSTELTDKYRGDIAQAATQLTTDLDSIGHSLHGDPGASTTPTYVRASSASSNPTVEQAAVHQGITGESQPQVAPRQLPEMPRAVTAPSSESASGASTPSAPAAPHPVNPTLANLIGGQGSTPTGTPSGTASPHASPQGSTSPSPQAHQQTERPNPPRPSALPRIPRIPSLPLDGLPAAAAESVATVVSSATAHQLPTAPSTITPSIPASTGFTPGTPGTPPVTPVTPTPLTPIGGGGLSAPAATQPATPAPQGTPAPQPTTTPSPTRSPAADATWIQRTYGLAPGIESPKPEPLSVPALFITELSEPEALLHRVLGTLRQQFEQVGWAQPLAVATIRRGFETRLVYVTADAVSIHPRGVLLPHGLTPLDEMPSAPVAPELAGSIMVSEKLKALIPYGWEVEGLVSTLPADENHQSPEHYQELVGAGELLPCTVSRGRQGVTAGEAMSTFARAALGSAGCSDLYSESARLRAARWIGTQPVGYLDVLARYHLADAAEAVSEGRWAEAVYCSERYLSVVEPKSQAA
ncbi:Uncharacterised protein [Mycobacteroides abscessus subsp. abscessus]|nr:Uncharacterised protein [Mycobacteroides abscessus subsp. abscessus]